MKKIIALFLCAFAFADFGGAFGAVKSLAPKKAAAVAKKETSATSSIGSSLLPTAIGLVSAGMALSNQQKALAAECEPTQSEISFVNNLVKEWAIAGAVLPSSGWKACDADRKQSYKDSVANTYGYGDDGDDICYDVFSAEEARGAVWEGFPKADIATYCPDGEGTCTAKNTKKVSNMWEIFQQIDFTDSDYTSAEASQAAKLKERVAQCAPDKLNAKKMEAVGGFVKSTIANMGKPTGTESIMESVSGMLSQGGGLGGTVGSLATVATQFIGQ